MASDGLSFDEWWNEHGMFILRTREGFSIENVEHTVKEMAREAWKARPMANADHEALVKRLQQIANVMDALPEAKLGPYTVVWTEGAKDVREAATALESLAAQWQTMESAPKDGQHVLLAITGDDPPGYGWVCEGYFETDGDRGWFKAETHWTDAYDGSVTPNYWQPLPAPPTEQDKP